MESRQGEDKNSIGNVEAKELICMTMDMNYRSGRGRMQVRVVQGGGE